MKLHVTRLLPLPSRCLRRVAAAGCKCCTLPALSESQAVNSNANVACGLQRTVSGGKDEFCWFSVRVVHVLFYDKFPVTTNVSL
jgi:hypothetical protein